MSGNLDFGMWGNTPIVRLIAQNQPLQLADASAKATSASCSRRARIRRSATSPTSRARPSARCSAAIRTTCCRRCCASSSATPIPKAHGITVVNTPTQAQAATIPTGMDAAMLIHPAFLKANAEIGTVGIMNSFGYTESHYQGPAGEGAGHLLESVKKSPFYPDGYYLHRSFWIGHTKLIESDPGARHRVPDGAAGSGREALRDGPGRGVRAGAASTGSSIAEARRAGGQGRRAVRARLVLADRGRRRRGARDLEVHGRGQADPEAARPGRRCKGAFAPTARRCAKPTRRAGASRTRRRSPRRTRRTCAACRSWELAKWSERT